MIVVCHGVSPRAASISLELLAKCSLRHSTVALQLGDRSISRSQVLKQVRTFVENQPIFYKECLLTAVLSPLAKFPHIPSDIPPLLGAPPTAVPCCVVTARAVLWSVC